MEEFAAPIIMCPSLCKERADSKEDVGEDDGETSLGAEWLGEGVKEGNSPCERNPFHPSPLVLSRATLL